MNRCVPLECAAEKVCNQSAVPPYIFQLPPEQGRKILEEAQNTPVYKYPAHITLQEVDTQGYGKIPVYVVTPEQNQSVIRNIFYIHGAGWVFGSFHTHEKLVRELSARTNSRIIFPEYTRSPEVKYPVANRQCYYILSHLEKIIGEESGCQRKPLIVAGDSVGGNMAIAMCLMCQKRGGPKIQKLLLYYPVTNACFNTSSYCQFAVN